MIEPSQ